MEPTQIRRDFPRTTQPIRKLKLYSSKENLKAKIFIDIINECPEYYNHQFIRHMCMNSQYWFNLTMFKIIYDESPKYILLLLIEVFNEGYNTLELIKFINEISEYKNKKLIFKATKEFKKIPFIIRHYNIFKKANESIFNKIKNLRNFDKWYSIEEELKLIKSYEKDMMKQNKNQKHYDAENCPVCYKERFKYVWLPCGHNICRKCYALMKERNCPVCRHKF